MLLSEISEDPDDHAVLVAQLINNLIDKGEEVWYHATYSNDPYEVMIEAAEAGGKWVTIDYGLPSQRTGDITKWDSADLEAEKVSIEKSARGTWWVHEAD
jgi:hypothetical protein